ncbi:MAG: hypothetical protein J6Y77_01820 [Paludibacteraceae bacterium]|nr:hypothetical protein [Paludibacteraceae bacterium]
MKKSLLTSLLTVCCLLASANIRQPIENFYKNDYGMGAQNRDIAQQHNGLMYFANMNGLLEYDGHQWQSYLIPEYAYGNNYHCLCIDDKGNIYVGAYNEFGVFRSSETGLQPYESLSDNFRKNGRDFAEIWHINQLGESIVFQTNSELIIYENGQLRLVDLPHIIHHSTVIDGTLYLVSTTEGISILDNDDILPLKGCESLRGTGIIAIDCMNDKSLLIVTETGKLYRYDKGELEPFCTHLTAQMENCQAYCAKLDGNVLAIGTVQDGVFILQLQQNTVTHINAASGLQNNTVLSLEFDTEGNLWLGLDRGIDFVKINSPFRRLFAQNNPYGGGYCAIKKGEKLYLGTNQGLFVTNYTNGDIGDIQAVQGVQNMIYNLREIDGRIFCCAHKGLYEVIGNTAVKISDTEGVWTLQKWQKNPEYLIGGCYTGFFIMEKNGSSWKLRNTVSGFVESSRVFEQDLKGDIWMSHGLRGVYRLHLSDDLRSVEKYDFYGTNKGFPNNEHITVYKISDEIIFAAENGINRYNERTDQMELYKSLNDELLGDGLYYYLNQESFGRLWYVKGNKIGYAERQNNMRFYSDTAQCFSIPETLIYEYFNLTRLDENNVLISNEEGFTKVNLETLKNTNSHELYIRQVRSIDTDSILVRQYEKNGDSAQPLKIEYKLNSLRFVFGSSSFADQRNPQILYATRLLGCEDNWSNPSNAQEREYTNLHEGVYTFQIKTVNRDGSSNFTELTFSILPPWYRSIWAYILYGLIGILTIFALIHYIHYKEQKIKRQKELEIEEQRRLHQSETAEKEKEITMLKNEQLAADLTNKSKELASSTMNLIRKNEILIDIKNELDKILKSMPDGEEGRNTGKKLNKVIHTINENIEHDDDWMKFEQNFDSIHQDFMKRLGETYKGLTISDKKLCAYLKMNLVSKDIAPLLNISVRGVEIGRYRLRKKLGLDRDTNLTEFLQNF